MTREDTDPSQRSKDCHGRDKVVEDDQSVTGRDEIGETHEGSGKDECDPWDTSAGALCEDSRGVAIFGHSVQSSRGNVLVRVGSGKGKQQETARQSCRMREMSPLPSIDDRWQNVDTGRQNGNDKWRSRSSTGRTPPCGLREESRVGIDNHTNDQDAENVEKDDSVKCLADGGGDSLAWVFGFADRHTDELCAHVGEKSEHEGIDEGEEFTEIARLFPCLEGFTVFPVPEAQTFLSGDTSEIDNQTEEDQAGKCENLDE